MMAPMITFRHVGHSECGLIKNILNYALTQKCLKKVFFLKMVSREILIPNITHAPYYLMKKQINVIQKASGGPYINGRIGPT